MQGAKAYFLPGVALLVLLAYLLLVPGVDDQSAPSHNSPADPPEAGAPATFPHPDAALEELTELVPTDAPALPEEYVSRQKAIVQGSIVACDVAEPLPYRVTLLGVPGKPARIERVETTVKTPGSADECVRAALRSLQLAAPSRAGRSVLSF